MKRFLRPAVVAAILAATPAGATFGGPTMLEVLGWDPGAMRLWMREIPRNEGDMFGAVLYFDLASTEPARLHDAGWRPAGEGSASDTMLARRLGELRGRLQPLTRVPEPVLPIRIEPLGVDSVSFMLRDRRARTLVRAKFDGLDSYELHTYAPERGVSRSVWRIPGRRERLMVFSYIGDRAESGYEVQVPVLSSPGDPEPGRIRWRLERD